MSNIKQVINKKGEVVYEHKLSGPDPDFLKLGEKHGLPLLHIDHDDSNRLIAIVESIRCHSCMGSGRNRDPYRSSPWCERCGGDGILMGKGERFESVYYTPGVAERWRSEMTKGGAFGDLYWEPPPPYALT